MPTLMKLGATNDIKATVKAYYEKLKADDSFFHWNSRQFKDTLSAMEALIKDDGKDRDLSQLKLNTVRMNVKKWVESGNRDHKHLNNEFDNKRYNTMFALMYELDPRAAKKMFTDGKDITFSLEHGEKAKETEFFDLEDCVLNVQLQLRDEGRLKGKEHLFDGATVLVGKEAVKAKKDALVDEATEKTKDDPVLQEMVQMKMLAEDIQSKHYFNNKTLNRHLNWFIDAVKEAEGSHDYKSSYKVGWNVYKQSRFPEFGETLRNELKNVKKKDTGFYHSCLKLLNFVSPTLAKGLGYDEKKKSVIPTNLDELDMEERKKLKKTKPDPYYTNQKKEIAKQKAASSKKGMSAAHNNGNVKPKKDTKLL